MGSLGKILAQGFESADEDEQGQPIRVYIGCITVWMSGLGRDFTIQKEFLDAQARDAWLKMMEDGLDGAEIEQERGR